jgi:hypothetical protein
MVNIPEVIETEFPVSVSAVKRFEGFAGHRVVRRAYSDSAN